MKGMSKGDNTRSGLLWEVERLLNEVEELPQVLIMENVPQVHSQDNMPDFQKWIDFLTNKGYSNYWQDLNARDYGVAQNRNRCFMVSILGEYNFKFPKPIPLDKNMKEYLEDTVEDKYYITSEKAQKLIDTLILDGKIPNGTERNGQQLTSHLTNQELSTGQTVSKQDMTMESLTCKQMDAVLLSGQGSELEKVTDVANTLMARDYKGFGNQSMNGVLECEKIT